MLIITDPQALLEDGRLHPGAFVRFDRSGLSVLRERADDAEFKATLSELRENAAAASKECFLHGVLSFKAFDVRWCAADRFLCVFDTAMETKPAHAELMRTLKPEDEVWSNSRLERERRAFAKEIRAAIGDAFSTAREFRDGALVEFAR